MSDYTAETQLPLFAQIPVEPKQGSEQDVELQRVRRGISGVILEFWGTLPIGGQFYAATLHAYVNEHSGRAPASADRILRSLRSDGTIDYEVERSKSLYTKVK